MATPACGSGCQEPCRVRAQLWLCVGILALLTAIPTLLEGTPSSPPCIRANTRPHHEATLSPTSPGRIERILVHEGSCVTNGQALVELDRAHEELEVQRRKLVYESQAELKAAQARVHTFKRDLQATQKLYSDSKSVSREELDRKQLEFDLAESELLKTEISKKREHIEYKMALKSLKERWLFSPLTGNVTKIHMDEGESCEQQLPLVTVVDTSLVECVANVAAAMLADFEEGQSVELDVDVARGTRRFTGTVSYVAPVIDSGSGLGTLIVVIQNPDGVILPGVAATILPSSKTGAME
jgi:RND family efflux transporter MFP subunit